VAVEVGATVDSGVDSGVAVAIWDTSVVAVAVTSGDVRTTPVEGDGEVAPLPNG
jgi:hypothetical protein